MTSTIEALFIERLLPFPTQLMNHVQVSIVLASGYTEALEIGAAGLLQSRIILLPRSSIGVG